MFLLNKSLRAINRNLAGVQPRHLAPQHLAEQKRAVTLFLYNRALSALGNRRALSGIHWR